MTTVPFISCLCPTFRRRKLLENAIACFESQDYEITRRELLILDDSGELEPQSGAAWELFNLPRRFRSLPEKFNALAGLARGEILVVWEDDDVYLPWHLSAHAKALERCGFSQPSRVLSLYSGQLAEEPTAGRFHASLACTRDAFDRAGGWPMTKRADFDQSLIKRLNQAAGGTADPCELLPPSYVFRWRSTEAYHGQAAMRSVDDETWYDRAARHSHDDLQSGPLVPALDEETSRVYAQFR